MSRFFGKSENISENTIILDGGDYNHIKNVLRMKKGDILTVTGGNNKDYSCSIKEFTEDAVVLDIVKIIDTDKELPARIHIFQGIPKGDKMELIIQKCVELGVYEIIPVSMKRCIARYDDKKVSAKIARFQSISESAAKQSGRAIIPQVNMPMSFTEALEYAKNMDVKVIPYELAKTMEATKEAFAQIDRDMDIAVFIGPEGGFDVSEVEKAQKEGFKPISLGKRILRTETAGFTVMAILMYQLETKE